MFVLKRVSTKYTGKSTSSNSRNQEADARKAPRAIQEIKKFARLMMGTSDVRVEAGLNNIYREKHLEQFKKSRSLRV